MLVFDAAARVFLLVRAFFWGGWGGSLAIVDLDLRASIVYVINRMEADLMGDLRGGNIAGAAIQSLMA